MTLVERIRYLCDQNGTSIYAMEKVCGFGNGTINKWDKSSPSIEKVAILANFLGTTIDHLYTGSEPKGLDSSGPELNDIERELVKEFRQLDDRDKADITGCIKSKLARTFTGVHQAGSLTSASGNELMEDEDGPATA